MTNKKAKAKFSLEEKFYIGFIIFTIVFLIYAIPTEIANNARYDKLMAETDKLLAETDELLSRKHYSIDDYVPAEETEEVAAVVEEEESITYELVEYDLPSKYYEDLDFSSFQAYMSYKLVTDKTSAAYRVCRSQNAYTDSEGFRRIETNGYKINGQDDYVIALGTYYNDHLTAGSRWLIETSNGSYTATVGDEKQDIHTDSHNMFGVHGANGDVAGMIEWIVDPELIDPAIKIMGSVTASDNPLMQGEILHIYKIIDKEVI